MYESRSDSKQAHGITTQQEGQQEIITAAGQRTLAATHGLSRAGPESLADESDRERAGSMVILDYYCWERRQGPKPLRKSQAKQDLQIGWSCKLHQPCMVLHDGSDPRQPDTSPSEFSWPQKRRRTAREAS